MKRIINLEEYREENTPHLSGTTLCLTCDYECVSVAPIGTVWMRCPKCLTEKMTWIYPCEYKEKHWKCSCDNFLFYITPDYVYCAKCGLKQKGF